MKLNENLVVREVAGDVLLMPTGSLTKQFNGVFTLNPIAAEVIKVIRDGGGKKEALARILEEFDTDEATASKDIDEFIAYLTDNGLASQE